MTASSPIPRQTKDTKARKDKRPKAGEVTVFSPFLFSENPGKQDQERAEIWPESIPNSGVSFYCRVSMLGKGCISKT